MKVHFNIFKFRVDEGNRGVRKRLCSNRSINAHNTTVIEGAKIAASIRIELRNEIKSLFARYNKRPSLSTVLLSNKHELITSLSMKRKACEEVGIINTDVLLPEDVKQDIVVSRIIELNKNPNVHGIIVQLPLPTHINERMILDSIDSNKDIDGLHSSNVYRLLTSTISPPSDSNENNNILTSSDDEYEYHKPCTPQACIELLDRYQVDVKGKDVVVIGRSNVVGLPVAVMLIKRSATVTILHSFSNNIQEKIRRADIVICAIGKPEFIKGDWLKPGAVVIDVGINSVQDPSHPQGYRLLGDVEFQSAKSVASLITPVPGGVGPVTIAMIMKNTINSFKRTLRQEKVDSSSDS